jgi:hypothetical protein
MLDSGTTNEATNYIQHLQLVNFISLIKYIILRADNYKYGDNSKLLLGCTWKNKRSHHLLESIH